MPSITCEYPLLFLFCIFMDSCQSFSNDATEIVNSQLDFSALDTQTNASLNRARNGGKRLGSTERSEQSQVGCRELRSTKYISDGQCTSLSPVKELVCAGECLPPHMVPNWIGGYVGRFWARREGQSWKCVNDRSRTQRIRLQCQDGTSRTYKITAVTSCKCKHCSRQHNDSSHNPEKVPGHVRAHVRAHVQAHEHKSKAQKPKGRSHGEPKKKMTPTVERD